MAKTAIPAHTHIKVKLIAAMRKVPPGRVVTYDVLAAFLETPPRHVETLLGHLSDDEREGVSWHRAVAKGGAIGWGPVRDAKFQKLVREGVAVSPAGIVQDMARATVTDLASLPVLSKEQSQLLVPPTGLGRARGMKDRPR